MDVPETIYKKAEFIETVSSIESFLNPISL